MIRSVKLNLKFANANKQQQLLVYLTEYRRVVSWFINKLWESNQYKFVDKTILSQCNTWLSIRSKQCAGKQALAIINGTWKKHKQRVWRYEQLKNNGENTKYLEKYINNTPSKPNIDDLSAELDSRFIKIGYGTNSFDIWVTFTSLGSKIKVSIPLKMTKCFHKWYKLGKLKSCVRLSKKYITLMFEVDTIVNNRTNNIGIDIGMTNILSCSDNQQVVRDKHGHTLKSICKTLSKRSKISNGFKRAQQHRKNFINWSVNQLNLNNVKIIKIENIKNMRKGKRTSRLLSHFTYADIFRKLELLCEEKNVSLVRVNPAYTSQKCSSCDNIQTKNRSGEKFICKNCGYKSHADINAAKNILTSV